MQVEVRVYHICFANPNCRHGKRQQALERQALERPVLRNLSKGREAGYKDSPKIPDSCCISVGLDFTLIVTNITVIPSWSIVISVSLRGLCLPWLWALFKRNLGDIAGEIWAWIYSGGEKYFQRIYHTLQEIKKKKKISIVQNIHPRGLCVHQIALYLNISHFGCKHFTGKCVALN